MVGKAEGDFGGRGGRGGCGPCINFAGRIQQRAEQRTPLLPHTLSRLGLTAIHRIPRGQPTLISSNITQPTPEAKRCEPAIPPSKRFKHSRYTSKTNQATKCLDLPGFPSGLGLRNPAESGFPAGFFHHSRVSRCFAQSEGWTAELMQSFGSAHETISKNDVNSGGCNCSCTSPFGIQMPDSATKPT